MRVPTPHEQVAVALMLRMDTAWTEGHPNLASATRAFAASLLDAWGVGGRHCDNGVLLLVSRSHGQVHMAVGSGAAGRLPADARSDIMQRVRLLLREGRYDEAIQGAVTDIGLALAGGPAAPKGESLAQMVSAAICAAFALAVWLTDVWHRRHWRRQRTEDWTSTMLERLKQRQATLPPPRVYNANTCGICLLDFACEAEVDLSAAKEDEEAEEASQNGAAAPTTGSAASQEDGAAANAAVTVSGGASGAPSCGQDPTAAAGEAAEAQQRPPLVLPCGHAFCEPCITA
ncbi:hypothetical protein GPECTOR_4g702 [Gonium pectorale]|uniref:Uncharacterized protein n=1 Tax=Gonium pectorale TaxID=33097 RepID=A0A150GXM6_GONPE|nr:hypothetical protein GPECTOR_4g702 [Gonium pectorale]|eukprot:KXZ54637.1 hypothetical protein GPECTOR_4g702 [Gonium pectorale]